MTVTNLKVPFIIISINVSNQYNVSINLGPIQRSPDINSTILEPLSKKSLHFLHIKTNSLLSKKDEIRCIVNKNKTSIIGRTESKHDHAVPDSEVSLPGYDIL